MRITQSSDLTPAMLTELLIACGVLWAGSVTAVACDMESSQKGFISNVATFNVTYSRDAGGELPHRLFLKVTKSDLHPEYRQVGQHEISFYITILPPAYDLPVPRCYYAEWDAATQHAALLLADLSHSHFQRPLPLPPAPAQCQRIAESLARMHAHWWSHPQLGKTIGTPLTPDEVMPVSSASKRAIRTTRIILAMCYCRPNGAPMSGSWRHLFSSAAPKGSKRSRQSPSFTAMPTPTI